MANTEERGEAGGWESGVQMQERKDTHAQGGGGARQAKEQAPPALLLRTAQREPNAPRAKGRAVRAQNSKRRRQPVALSRPMPAPGVPRRSSVPVGRALAQKHQARAACVC
jgi:hypothetical protein